jgi:HD domain/CRISPR-associated protein Cse1 (CRISPR_cse1)
LGGHHGVPPDAFSLTEGAPSTYPKLYGEGVWEQVQRELIERMADRTGADGYLDAWRDVELTAQFQVVATGLVIISDWIASNESLLPFAPGRLPGGAEPQPFLAPGVLQWISDLASQGLLPETYRPGIRVCGIEYGPQQATVAEIVDDVLPVSIVVLRADRPAAGKTAENAVKDAEHVAYDAGPAVWLGEHR